MINFSELGIETPEPKLIGQKIPIEDVLNIEIKVLGFEIRPSKFRDKNSENCLCIQIELEGNKRVIFTGSGKLLEVLRKVRSDQFPFKTTIKKVNKGFYFT
jgi:hypothetical protein